ncbi:MAG: dihydrodipicolinate synthase family protein [Phaeobacter gallaeciensis]|jgi:4-hydroxy-tetrahydrodipicolinate synthase|uniref:4-hydroxy-tetrahydrodipicolinate synthase n=1 Tax=Lentibacter algarum TaxID=576131 RepID=A0A1H3NMK3_9RHOB|nr:dihydrodipicolinate synthase family protein [Lentibacter algarum]SDY90136.1 4-hydroxy-tetrahydrodipicolinate synthase [Lentibacter algarum]
MKFEGIYTPVITPHRADGSIDRDALVLQIEHLISSGVHGLINGGSTGEYYAQSMDERKDMATFAKDVIGGRVPLIVGTVSVRTEDSILMAEHAAKIGADALLVGSPPYSVPTERENALNALAIDRAADLPIMLYNYPGRMGIDMGEEFLDRVGRSRNFAAIKESSGDINRVHLLARDYPHIQMSCGMDDQALEFFAWGARSWVCAGSNFLPTEHIALWRACAVEGDFDKGRRIMSAMMPLMRVLEQGGKFIQAVKHGCEMAGQYAGPPRPPLHGLNKDDKRQLEQVVRVLKRTVAQIEAEPRT